MPYNVAIQAYGAGDENYDSDVVNTLPPTLGEPVELAVTATPNGEILTSWQYSDSGEKDSLTLFRVFLQEQVNEDPVETNLDIPVEEKQPEYSQTLSVEKSGSYEIGVQAIGVEGLVSDPVMTVVYVTIGEPVPVRKIIKMRDSDRTQSLQRRSERGYGQRHFHAEYGRSIAVERFAQSSRYDGLRIVTLTSEDGQTYRTIETWERPYVPRAGAQDKYFFVDNTYAHRSDRIAKMLHGDENLRWWILQSNGLFEDEQLVHGLTLRIVRPPNEGPYTPQWSAQ